MAPSRKQQEPKKVFKYGTSNQGSCRTRFRDRGLEFRIAGSEIQKDPVNSQKAQHSSIKEYSCLKMRNIITINYRSLNT